MSDNIEYLAGLKKELEQAKVDKSKLEGVLEVLMTELREKFNCDSLEDAINKLEQLETSIVNRTTRLNKSIENLKAKIEKDLE